MPIDFEGTVYTSPENLKVEAFAKCIAGLCEFTAPRILFVIHSDNQLSHKRLSKNKSRVFMAKNQHRRDISDVTAIVATTFSPNNQWRTTRRVIGKDEE